MQLVDGFYLRTDRKQHVRWRPKSTALLDPFCPSSCDKTDNYCSGLSNNGKVTFEEGTKLTITGNANDKGDSSYGGGVYNSGDAADLTLPSDAVIYDNHAATGGDDIFNNATAKITFGSVGSDWALDGDPDCTDAIDGWYDDSEGSRWEAHNRPLHAQEVEAGTVTGLTALKAAHGLIPLDPDDPDAPTWETSKSKTATNLDENYESDVTLSLPAAEEELVSDIVFVIDESSCSEPVRQCLTQTLRWMLGASI